MPTTAADAQKGEGRPPGQPRIYAHGWTLLPVMKTVESARFAADNDLQGIELLCTPLEFWPGMVPAATTAELAAIGRGEGIGYALYGGPAVNAATGLAEVRALNDDMMRRMLDLCDGIGATVIGVHAGTIPELDALERKGVPFHTDRFDRDEILRDGQRRAVEALARWAEMAAPYGITVVVENDSHVRHTAAPTAEALLAMVEAADHPNLRINFDTGHAFIGAGLLEEFNVLKSRIGHFHLDDNSTPELSEHLPVGEGIVDFPAIAGYLATADAALSIEIFAPDRPVEATLASRDYVRALIAGARPELVTE